MAESEANQPIQPLAQRDGGENEKQLKHLEFVQNAVIYFIVCFSTVYEYAKAKSGSLKPGFETVENTVKTVFGPVYERFRYVPFEVLKFSDLKVDNGLKELNCHIPSLMKQLPNQAKYVARNLPEVTKDLARNLPEVAKDLAHEALQIAIKMANALYIKYEPTAKQLYTNYEPVAEKYAVTTWQSMNKLPIFPQVAQIAVPTGAYLLEKYNITVCYTAEKGYIVARYLPLVPIDKIAKVFEDCENGPVVGNSVQVET